MLNDFYFLLLTLFGRRPAKKIMNYIAPRIDVLHDVNLYLKEYKGEALTFKMFNPSANYWRHEVDSLPVPPRRDLSGVGPFNPTSFQFVELGGRFDRPSQLKIITPVAFVRSPSSWFIRVVRRYLYDRMDYAYNHMESDFNLYVQTLFQTEPELAELNDHNVDDDVIVDARECFLQLVSDRLDQLANNFELMASEGTRFMIDPIDGRTLYPFPILDDWLGSDFYSQPSQCFRCPYKARRLNGEHVHFNCINGNCYHYAFFHRLSRIHNGDAGDVDYRAERFLGSVLYYLIDACKSTPFPYRINRIDKDGGTLIQ